MGFLSLGYSWAVVFPIAVILYYFFRKRYESKTISSTLFWEQSMQEIQVSPYLKTLQRNALFYLQLLAMLVFLFMLLSPYIKKEQVLDQQTIIIVDTSATMMATKEGKSLFNQQKEQLQKLVTDHEGHRFTIVTTGKEPVSLVRDEENIRVVHQTIDDLAITYEHEYLERAIEFAASLTTAEGATIHIFSDAVDRTIIPETDRAINWVAHPNTEKLHNISIEKFGAIQTETGLEAIVKVTNDTAERQEGVVQIVDALTNTSMGEAEFTVEKEASALVSFKKLPARTVLQAKINIEDDYVIDNEAFALIGNDLSEAMIDQKLHFLIQKAYEAMNLPVSTGATQELRLAQSDSIIVTDNVDFLQIGTEPILLIGRDDRIADDVSGIVTQTSDDLFSILNLEDVYVSSVFPPFEEYSTIAFVGEHPFIQRSPRGDIVVLTSIDKTDWPLHPSFPLFFWSATEKLRSSTNIIGLFAPNERKAVLSAGGEEAIELYTTEGQYVSSFTSGAQFTAPEQPGVYKVLDNGQEKFAVVQLEDVEKKLQTGEPFQLGQSVIGEEKEEGKQLINWYLLLPLLVILLVEWEVQRRRGYSN